MLLALIDVPAALTTVACTKRKGERKSKTHLVARPVGCRPTAFVPLAPAFANFETDQRRVKGGHPA